MMNRRTSNRKRRCEAAAAQAKKKETSASQIHGDDFLDDIKASRLTCATSIKNFKFHKKRVRVLSSVIDISETSNGVLYWMSRDERIQDNWALLYAQHLALKIECPLHICFCLVTKFLDATIRHYQFLLKGLQEVAKECKALNISFHLLLGDAPSVLPKFVSENKIGGVVTDFSPLRLPLQWVENVKANLPPSIPFCQVDAHNIVPCWIASDKQEYAARTIRPKICGKLLEFFTEYPPVIKHPYSSNQKAEDIDWKAAESFLEVDKSVKAVDWATPGTAAGLHMLNEFCMKRLEYFNIHRNDPTKDCLSKLSPWIHFGQISAQRCALVVRQYKSKYAKSVDAYCEEVIVRRELADNFCFYNPKYDSTEGASDWAKKTMSLHAKDKREYIYTRDQLEQSLTHDPLWNAAQKQMVQEGKMHGFLRMYWAKKILEWTNNPNEALAFALYLNDKYELDGRDPNGYVGCSWSICGVHDNAWPERPIFGKIRYMNFQGCKRKFDVCAFIEKYKIQQSP